jgi:uncharacterized protein YfaS (alpha-2-macroglobulin family)
MPRFVPSGDKSSVKIPAQDVEAPAGRRSALNTFA